MTGGRPKRWSERSYRRILIDAHIPDWRADFLSKLNADGVVGAVEAAGAQAAMLYFQSHVGLCNWPSEQGVMHRGIQDADFLHKTISALHARDIPVCGYFSVHFDNWAAETHAAWGFVQSTKNTMGPLPMARYGLCCSNNPEYRGYVRSQAKEIARDFEIDAMFFDMMWQPGVCGCAHCQTRYAGETGRTVPRNIDWDDADWCAFQTTRERWSAEWAAELRDIVRHEKPELEAYHNFAMGVSNWSRAQSFASAAAHDFLGGDFYGGRDEQLVVCKLMLNLSEHLPIEFMTTVTAGLTEHETLKSQDEHDLLAYAATAHSAAFLAIAAFDPDGGVNAAALKIIRKSFDRIAPYESYLGGVAIEDVAVYFGGDSKVRLDESGAALNELVTSGASDYPHFHAVRGACRALQAAHIPFGVITRKQLAGLDRFKLVVLPNVLRMDAEECSAIREYVRRGGKIYASRLTSLLDTQAGRGSDFALADVFGVSYVAEEVGQLVYLEPRDDLVANGVAPQRRLAHALGRNSGAARLKHAAGQALATLTLPFGHPHPGAMGDANWASIHSSPPHERLAAPAIARNEYGAGTAIYCAADIETAAGASRKLFTELVQSLLSGESLRVETNAPESVWINAFEQADRIIVTVLNYQSETPVSPVFNIDVAIRAVAGRRLARAFLAPHGELLPCEPIDGGVKVRLAELSNFALIACEYEGG